MTVSEMCAKMSFSEFVKWQQFMEMKAAAERGEKDPMRMGGDDFARAFGAQ